MRIQQKKKHRAQFHGSKAKTRKLAFQEREKKREERTRQSMLPMVIPSKRQFEHMKSVAVLQDMMFPYLLRGE